MTKTEMEQIFGSGKAHITCPMSVALKLGHDFGGRIAWIAGHMERYVEDDSYVDWFSLKWTPSAIMLSLKGEYNLDPWSEVRDKVAAAKK